MDNYIYYLQMAEIPKLFKFEDFLSDVRKAKIAKAHSDNAVSQHIFAELLLIYAISRHIGNIKVPLQYYYDKQGKPHCDCGLEFSISHTEGAVAVAVSDAAIGVDLENTYRVIACASEKKLLTEPEQKVFAEMASRDKPLFLLTTLVKKESAVKAIGCGLVGLPNTVDLSALKGYNIQVQNTENNVIAVTSSADNNAKNVFCCVEVAELVNILSAFMQKSE